MDYRELLTLKELCQLLKVEKVWVYRQTREKAIPFIKMGKYLRFERSRIEKWLKDNSHD
jgi:excisionase family DNA binding protein